MNQEWILSLHAGNYSLLVANGIVRTFHGRGIDNLYHLYQENANFLHQSQIADKIVGKAAAAILILASVREIYADVISEQAACMLDEAGIPYTYGVKVPHIINRRGTGLCPLEIRCRTCSTPRECLEQIQDFLLNKPIVEH